MRKSTALFLAAICLTLALHAIARATPPTTQPDTQPDPQPSTAGMAWIPPNPPTSAPGFWIDQTDVTNAQFGKFVEATGYITTAEQKVDWKELSKQLPPGTPKLPDDQLQPGSIIFSPPDHPVDLTDQTQWWTWTAGANWQHPQGPKTNITGLDDHPVVQVSWTDAQAYAKWAGKQLPTEAQWEFAARGGLVNKTFVWGDTPPSPDHPQCNYYHGHFPDQPDPKFPPQTTPVKQFPPNGYGLYDMSGNVWQWTRDADAANPTLRVLRGGSFLCSQNYCCGYRLDARQTNTPDTSLPHTGFRCVLEPQPK